MQTSGTSLLAVERCSLMRVWIAAQDSRSAHGLLYFAAERDDCHHLTRSRITAVLYCHVLMGQIGSTPAQFLRQCLHG
jgi:hypothetical protein